MKTSCFQRSTHLQHSSQHVASFVFQKYNGYKCQHHSREAAPGALPADPKVCCWKMGIACAVPFPDFYPASGFQVFHPSKTWNSLKKRVLEERAPQREVCDNFSFCSCDLPLPDWKELWAHTQESRKSLLWITCKMAQFEKHAAERMKPDCKGECFFFFLPWIGFQTSSQSESLYILAICHFQSIRPYALLTIILNYTY